MACSKHRTTPPTPPYTGSHGHDYEAKATEEEEEEMVEMVVMAEMMAKEKESGNIRVYNRKPDD